MSWSSSISPESVTVPPYTPASTLLTSIELGRDKRTTGGVLSIVNERVAEA